MGGEIQNVTAAEAASLLGWWLESGVDVALQEEPRDWRKRDSPPVAEPAAASPPAAREPERQLPETLDLFQDWLAEETELPLAGAGARRVLPKGAEGAPIMLLAEAPSGEDAAAGQPISGDAWALAEKMLAAIGLRVEDAYVANIACFHAPGARMNPAELDACAAIARRHVALAKPQRLLLLGEGPAQAMLGKPVATARGHLHSIEGVRTVATFHPRFLLKHSSSKRLAWKDLLLLMEETP